MVVKTLGIRNWNIWVLSSRDLIQSGILWFIWETKTEKELIIFDVTGSEHTDTVAGTSAEYSSQVSIVESSKKKQNPKTPPSDIIPLGRKLALAMGAAPLSLPIVSATVFITLFLLDVVLLKPRYNSIVLLVGRSFDAISDPVVGFLVNKTQRKGKQLSNLQ